MSLVDTKHTKICNIYFVTDLANALTCKWASQLQQSTVTLVREKVAPKRAVCLFVGS